MKKPLNTVSFRTFLGTIVCFESVLWKSYSLGEFVYVSDCPISKANGLWSVSRVFDFYDSSQ